MRLPTVTPGQHALEDARALHEAVWQASQAGIRHRIRSMPETVQREAKSVQWRFRHFWNRRGYRFHAHRTASGYGIELWVEPKGMT